MKTIAVLGASGFVGTRLVEMFHLGGRTSVRPLGSRVASRGPLARFALDWRVAPPGDGPALVRALEGCDCLIHLGTGEPATIRALAEPVYTAAARAGVRRLVFASSAAVHGQNPAPGTTEDSPPPSRHAFAYNAAKAAAENALRAARARRDVELVILRPGIVWGPRSRWVLEMMRALREGTFGWFAGGRGLINPIYVDNFVHAIDLACVAPVDGRAFLLNDPAPLTWREFYEPWLRSAGLTPDDVPDAPPAAPPRGWRAQAEKIRVHPAAQRAARRLPASWKRAAKALLLAPPAAPPETMIPSAPRGPAPLTEEMTALQRCAWRFPTTAAETALGWRPLVDWPEAAARTAAWLRFAGWLPELSRFPHDARL